MEKEEKSFANLIPIVLREFQRIYIFEQKSHFFHFQEDDKKKGGITLERYQELYAQFIGNADETCNACYLFGPLTKLD